MFVGKVEKRMNQRINQVLNQSGQVLSDISKNGKKYPWREKKQKSIQLAERLEKLGLKGFDRVYDCGDTLTFKRQEDGTLKLKQAWFCKNRQCPMCNWRRARKYSAQISQVLDVLLEREPNVQFLFLTLTVKNCEGYELDETIKKLHKAFNLMMRYAKVKKNLMGYVRATEISYNNVDGTYHPHIHVLLVVRSNYFSGRGENYITQKEWIQLWKKAMKLDYDPRVDVRKVYDHKGQGLVSAVKETAKYPVKPMDNEVDDEGEMLQITYDLYHGLKRKRLLSFGGILKDIKNELGLDDVEDGDLVNTDEDEKPSTEGEEIIAQWCWERANYFIL